MRLQSITLLLALGIAGTAACGGGGGASVVGGSSPANDGPYDTPPDTNPQVPTVPIPDTYDPPGTDYTPPPGQTEASGAGSTGSIVAVCTQLCNEILALDCEQFDTEGLTPANCPQLCTEAYTQIDFPCPAEYANALSCILDNIDLSCALFDDSGDANIDEEALARACQGPIVEFANCAGTITEQPPPDGGECMPGNCDACQDYCEYCLCGNPDDPGYCTDACATL